LRKVGCKPQAEQEEDFFETKPRQEGACHSLIRADACLISRRIPWLTRRMLFNLSEQFTSRFQRRLYRLFGPAVEKTLGLRDFEAIYKGSAHLYREHPQHPSVFAWFDSVAQFVGVDAKVDLPSEFEFPKQGPLILIANHPFGIIDPVLLARWAAQHRPGLKVMTNSLLLAMKELEPHIIAVNPFGGEAAAKSNLGPMKEAIRHLRGGGALVIFPAGEVASYRPGRGIEEPEWTTHLGSLVRRTQATVLPIYFPGSNTALFHAAGLIHPRLRTSLLLREFKRREGTTLSMRVGHPIPFTRLKKFEACTHLCAAPAGKKTASKSNHHHHW
jgi:1-acyl-sn-glycerol-3-phosphate acyltransferase